MFKQLFASISMLSILAATAYADEGIEKKDSNGASFIAYPVFGQLVGITLPKGFKSVSEVTKGPRYAQLFLPENESKEKFTKWISISGAKGLASDPFFLPHMMVSQITGVFQMTCPSTFSAVDLGTIKFSVYEAVCTKQWVR
ncbi:MAG: hypothetical protein PHY62_04660 [Gallionella sp.]|nr:hypothetical protein [Gallionella sp.]